MFSTSGLWLPRDKYELIGISWDMLGLYGDGSKPWYLVNPKIAGKWMFIPLKMVLIGIDPYPYSKSKSQTVVKTPISLFPGRTFGETQHQP